MREILRFCFEKHGEKRAEKSWKIAQSLPGDDSTDTSAADVLCHLYFYCCLRGNCFNAFRAGGRGQLALRSYGICAADDLSHYDVTSEPVREISMAAKR